MANATDKEAAKGWVERGLRGDTPKHGALETVRIVNKVLDEYHGSDVTKAIKDAIDSTTGLQPEEG